MTGTAFILPEYYGLQGKCRDVTRGKKSREIKTGGLI